MGATAPAIQIDYPDPSCCTISRWSTKDIHVDRQTLMLVLMLKVLKDHPAFDIQDPAESRPSVIVVHIQH
jgi:hypothetical protein